MDYVTRIKIHNQMAKVGDWFVRNEKKIYLSAFLITFGILLGIIFFNNHFTYEAVVGIRHIELDNSNRFISENYLSVECSEGVEVSLHKDAYYVSTWNNNETPKGNCTIEYLEVVPRLK